MAEAQETYQRLPGKGRRHEKFTGGAACTLWLGSDHILQAENLYFHEDYKRFYYRDIQAFILRRTSMYLIWNVVGVVVLALLLTPWLAAGGYWWLLVLLGLAPLAYHLYQGPSCVCYIRTAVQQEELPSLCRIKHAEQAIELIRGRISQAQGETTPEVLSASAATQPVELPAPGNKPVPGPLRHERGAFHWGTFSAVMASALCGAAGLAFKPPIAPLLCAGLLLTSFLLAIFAGIKQRGSDIPVAAQRLIWGTLVFGALLMFGLMQSAAVIEALERARKNTRPEFNMPDQRHLMTLYLRTLGHPIVNGIQIIACLCLAVPGFISMSLRRQMNRQDAKTRQEAPRNE